MKKCLLFITFFLYVTSINLYTQVLSREKNLHDKPEYFIPKNHDSNFLKLRKAPAKSFYESKSDWQHIIDSTWGPGDPLPQKLLIFNTYAQKVHDQFDGFLSLQLNWDSLYLYYLNQINDSTSKGAFSAIMSHFSFSLKDIHTRAVDTTVVLSALNPGVPILLLGSRPTVEHFGAVTTVLSDSNTLILRVVPNHPLNLEPGDIILGYEGVPWKDLVQELFDAGLPIFATNGGCESAYTYQSLFGAGINWHLFNTIDILKYSTGDTVHLSVLPLLNLNLPPMANNEQLPIPNIPFPDVLSNECVTYGVLNNTNIGYIYLAIENPEAVADYQFYEAVNTLKYTDALIIDMRLNYGGWALFDNAFDILFNDFFSTIADAYRCNTTTFQLCPSGDWNLFKIDGMPPGYYERPIAVLLGPSCGSMGDITAQRLRYHPMVRFFGASSIASLGDNTSIESYPGWYLRYSICDSYHLSKPDEYLNRREFPIDFPVWHNRDDVAIGKDVVVEKALYWIDNVVYPHNVITDKSFYLHSQDTVHLSTTIENPNSHQLSTRAYLKTFEGVLIDSIDLVRQTLPAGEEQWTGDLIPPTLEEFYNISVTAFDQTVITSFSLPNATKFTTVGPIILDSIPFGAIPGFKFGFKPYLKNSGTVKTITNAKLRISSTDPWITNINPFQRDYPNLLPGQTYGGTQVFTVTYDSAAFPGYFNLKFTISSDDWPYWAIDSTIIIIPTEVEEELLLPSVYNLEQNYPNPFNPSTKISWQSPIRSWQTLKVYNVLGREIRILVNEEKEAGYHSIDFDASDLPSGVYFYQLLVSALQSKDGKAGNFTDTKKMILLR